MNIALIGAPGSGKTILASRISNQLAIEDPECGCAPTIKIIDNYISEIETKTQIAINPTTSYLGNLYIALERYTRERAARLTHETVITCGTLVETAVYMAMQFMTVIEAMPVEARDDFAPRMDASLRIMAIFYNDILTYDHAFYLEVAEPSHDAEIIDRQLKSGLEGFKLLPVTTLAHGETRLEEVMKVIAGDHADQ